jgi:quinol monooxygenase YgiN
MEKIGLLALLEARAGMESAVKEFLESARTLALQEEDTISWFAFRVGPTTFGIFDTFADEDGRSAHLNGDIAKTLLARAEELLASPPQIQMVDILARKSSKT